MKAAVEWIVGRPYRPALVAAACAPVPLLAQLVTTPVLVLVTAHLGLQFGLATAAGGSAVLAALVVVTGNDVVLLGGGGALGMFAGAAVGGVLRWARNLSLAFQSVLLGCLALTAAVSLFGPDPDTMFGPLLETLTELVAQDATPAQLAAIRDLAPQMLGLLAAGLFAQLVVALIIGYWALGRVREDVALGKSFRALKLGRLLGIFGMVWVTLGLFVPLAVVQDLTPIAFMAFLFQGLAVMHAWAHGRQWHPGLVAPVYVLLVPLVPPLTVVVVMVLSAVGLLDNVFDLRAPLEGAA